MSDIAAHVTQAMSTSKDQTIRKRKITSSSDVRPQHTVKQVPKLKRLAPCPTPNPQQPNHNGQSSSTLTRASLPTNITMIGTVSTPIGTPCHPPGGRALFGSIPMQGDNETLNPPANIEEGLISLNHPSPGFWGLLSSPDPGVGQGGGEAHMPWTPQFPTPSRGRTFEPEWKHSAGLPLVTCPWRSHLERITSVELAISQISRRLMIQSPSKEELDGLLEDLEYLKRSYFKLQKCVQC